MRSAPVLVLALTFLAAGCRDATDPAPAGRPTESRQLGAWSGTGSTTLGFVSESGSFRITWTTTSREAGPAGTFQLTLRSGISGRPLRVIANSRGAGAGSTEFGDDPRLYEFLVESSGVDWTVSVDETFAPAQ